MVNFDRVFAYSLIPVGLTYPGEFLRPEVILSKRYLTLFDLPPLSPSICHFLKMP